MMDNDIFALELLVRSGNPVAVTLSAKSQGLDAEKTLEKSSEAAI